MVPPSLFILAPSVLRSLQCLISALTQGGEGGHLFRLICADAGGRDTAANTAGMCRECSHGWTTLGLPQPKTACPSCVHTTQAPGCSARALSRVGPAFCARPMSELLRFLGAPQGHRPRRAVCFVRVAGAR